MFDEDWIIISCLIYCLDFHIKELVPGIEFSTNSDSAKSGWKGLFARVHCLRHPFGKVDYLKYSVTSIVSGHWRLRA